MAYEMRMSDWSSDVCSSDLRADGSFRRAVVVSLWVCFATCTVTAALGLPLAYAIFSAAVRGMRLAVRLLYLLPIAVPPLVLGFGFILVFSSEDRKSTRLNSSH